ncbi:RHS repeat-associated core domain-containing protein [Pseudomonas sp. NPDC089395]|uniref:RHS repeat-associated core domain-containing protein n=1 Tax=Pseudomonas sp. NPDC089395 TaxID=3364460 RepID=UPI0038159F4C
MQSKRDATQLFYQNEKLSIVKADSSTRSVLRIANTPLAVKNNATPSAILISDRTDSVLGTIESNRLENELHAYTAYGYNSRLLSHCGPVAFNGERLEPITQNYALGNGYRLLRPNLMRFCSPDDLSPFGDGGLNSYMYCGGDPINNTDPSGHSIVKWIGNKFFGRQAKKIERIQTYNKGVNKRNDQRSRILYGKSYSAYEEGPRPLPLSPGESTQRLVDISTGIKKHAFTKTKSLNAKDIKYAEKYDIPLSTIDQHLKEQLEFAETLIAERRGSPVPANKTASLAPSRRTAPLVVDIRRDRDRFAFNPPI